MKELQNYSIDVPEEIEDTHSTNRSWEEIIKIKTESEKLKKKVSTKIWQSFKDRKHLNDK